MHKHVVVADTGSCLAHAFNKSQGYLMGQQISPADTWLRHSEDHSPNQLEF
jgi:hypothetical protein